MEFRRFLIVRKSSANGSCNTATKTYEGMQRFQLGSFTDVPDELLNHGLALEDMPPHEALISYQRLLADMLAMGVTDYELLMLGDCPSQNWQFLGYDVGETTKAAWSAIANLEIFLEPQEMAQWQERLNFHGLFPERADAKEFLKRYLESVDPDMGWTALGWTNTPDWYAVISVYRYCEQPETK